jgi:hypothetical protein
MGIRRGVAWRVNAAIATAFLLIVVLASGRMPSHPG